MMKYIFTAFLGLMLILAQGQILEEDTKVLNKIQGEGLFMLNSEEYVYSFEPDDGWYKIRKEVYADIALVTDNKYIAGAAILYNKDGEKIGSTLAEVEVVEGVIEQKYRGEERFRAIIEGYVFKTKIKDDSHPEERITKLLANKSRSEQTNGFLQLFNEYKFEERDFEEFKVYAFREVNKTLADEKDFRVMVIFRGMGSPFAVVTNEQTVGVPKIKAAWEDGSYKIIYFYKPTTTQAELIQDKVLYTFIGL